MKTPTEYTRLIKQGVITTKMLSDCLYSVNKRAKNWRDQEQKYRNIRHFNRYFYDKYDYEGKNREKKEEYYKIKDEILSVISPTCIHHEPIYKLIQYDEYDPMFEEVMQSKDYAESGEYYDRDLNETVMYVKRWEQYESRYYLFYDLGYGHTFHSPISSTKGYEQYEVRDIDTLETKGAEIDDLISVKFVKQVIELIRSGNYQIRDQNC
ncbi:MAG: hypothetical protein K6G81_05360 [Lachnospiraceae bacterium]|nr:hypothetical protein [Lachnospiraceae bacterium]